MLRRQKRVAIVEQTSTPPLDDGLTGALAALKERGYVDGGRMAVHRYNAQGDIATANAIAKEVTSGDFDLICFGLDDQPADHRQCQPVCHAAAASCIWNRHGPLFDRRGRRPKESCHSSCLYDGVGSMPPIEDTFRLAMQMDPSLKRVGLIWDPSQANSVVATKEGRKVCASMGLTLVEANAENSTMVGEATSSLLARGVDAIWVSPDLTTQNGIHVIVRQAKVAKIPVFTSMPNETTIQARSSIWAPITRLSVMWRVTWRQTFLTAAIRQRFRWRMLCRLRCTSTGRS